MLDQLLQYDQELFLYLNNLGNSSWDGFWMAYTSKFNWIPFYALLFYLMYKQSDLKAFIITVIMVALMILFTDQTTNLFKHGLERLRPCQVDYLSEQMRLVKPSCGGRYGFFSGHSSNTMAAAIFIGMMLRYRFKNLIFFLMGWAGLMAYSRVYIGVHYPLDILCGMIYGATSGFIFYRLNKYTTTRILR